MTSLPRHLGCLLLLSVLFATACAESQTGTTSTADPDASDAALMLDIAGADLGEDSADTLTELPDLQADNQSSPDTAVDTGTTTADTSGADGGCTGGEAGCPCTDNASCSSGQCIDVDGGKQCAALCGSGCTTGFKCVQVTGSGGDLVNVCVPATPRLCEPCTADSDCSNVLGGADNRCVPYTDDSGALVGNFCSSPCDAATPCPSGYSCEKTKSIGGIQTNQCVKQDLVCPCNSRAAQLGLKTACTSVNGVGKCGGKRACSAAGLSGCDAPAAASETCNNADDDCDGVTDEATPGMCDDGNPCSYDNCIAAECQHSGKLGACDDGSACTSGDTCNNGVCVGAALVCDDKNPCTTDSCDKAQGCTATATDGPCDDGDACTSGEVCAQGTCQPGNAIACDDNNPCTTDSCSKAKGCVVANNTLPCTDGDVCSPIDACKDGACTAGKTVNCSDGNPCTDDTCDPQNGCQFKLNSAPCSDGNVCTSGDACDGGACSPGTSKLCDDGNPCTADLCDTKQGCTTVTNAAPCDDGSLCTLGDVCKAGACIAGKAVSCDDGNPCTDDSCDAKLGCQHANNTAPCSDNNNCTLGDACQDGACVASLASPCDDGNACTTENCDAKQGCQSVANTAACNDDSVCTLGDSCSGGLCLPGSVVNCDDGNPCTNDSCDASKGCLHSGNAAPCSDGNLCTLGDACAGGLCAPGVWQGCSDGNACTDDFCDGKLGCQNQANALPCSDGSVCTLGDVCTAGACKAGGPVSCDDGNPCTDDACDPTKGCTHSNNTAPCNDNNGCTSGDTCSAGLCAPGAPCGNHASCSAFGPAGKCSCDAGYEGDGKTCADLNECAVGNGGCDVNAVCTNTPGAFTCSCKAGYSGTGKVCTDIDECANNPCGANTTCSNAPGSFACACKPGFADCDSNFAANGCEVNLTNDSNHCGTCVTVCPGGQTCQASVCKQANPTNFNILSSKQTTYNGYKYMVVKVSLAQNTSAGATWCDDYANLCKVVYGGVPVGCGPPFNPGAGGYQECGSIYSSNGVGGTLGCNASGGVAGAAQNAGYGDATGSNSFAFHYCGSGGSTCSKSWCAGQYCNTALSYYDTNQAHGYTLCLIP